MATPKEAVAGSEFWDNKMKMFFKRLDFNRNGELTYEDYRLRADRFIELGKLPEQRAREVRDKYLQVWTENFEQKTKLKRIDQQAFLEIFRGEEGKEALLRAVDQSLRLGFDIVDSNADGVIQLEEFTRFYWAYGFTEDVAKTAFEALDTNGDGLLSIDEYMSAAHEFVNSAVDNGTPSNLIFGSLR